MGRMKTKDKQIDVVTRFWSMVDIRDAESCWPWKGRVNIGGYGQFWNGYRQCMAHRFAYEATIGRIGKLYACHTCDTPGCCNPSHIFKGTQKDNMQDAMRKGRLVASNTTLSIDDMRRIETIIKLNNAGLSQAEIARMYGCTRQNISRICKEHKYRLYKVK
jgi:predicted XRE-type DNA-binding protein